MSVEIKVRTGAVTAVVCLALAAVVSAMSSLNVALPSVARSTHATQTQLSWIIDAYSLVFAALLLPAGALGDRFGRRITLLVGLGIFGSASVAAMTVSSAGALIGLRGVLGVGAALVMPSTLSTITSTFDDDQRPKAVGVWTGVAGGAAVLGLLASGLLLEVWSWRAVFGFNVVLTVIAIAGTLLFVPESADDDAPAIDLVGAGIVVVGLGALTYSIIEAPDEGWTSARTLAGIVLGLLGVAWFVLWSLRREHPLLDPRIFAQPRLAAGSLSVAVQFFAFFGFIFAMLQYLQLVRGDSPLVAAVSMLPMSAGLMPAARRSPQVVARFGARRVCCAGLVVVAAALAWLSTLEAGSSYLAIVAGIVPLGFGMGFAMTPATSGITESLPSAEQGVGSALNDLSRELGGALGIAVLGSVLSSTYRSHLHLSGVPAPIADRARDSLAVAQRIGGPVTAQAHSAFVKGLHAALLAGSGAALLAAFAVALLLRPSARLVGVGREARPARVEEAHRVRHAG